ncbi:phosphoglycerate dehydrogenase [Paenibacillus radicis (ex Xue et al. 2023)]|uniref:Phosphoglycerate dehydrogenase n=1 Tax=Paenibacillus radicis (ex Xue et al. 2023) TaxID=2972489 RepID=A0ABT1YIN1_9BACL|nr:phosphoglycerate dehydrogenase [Paenibacillus radicis (ex Xue et al. 2023)]MCR8633047.1 phosphoglycerate dehydrogenase [Paenibacillus radicis (ex Xue et al. 2023)]
MARKILVTPRSFGQNSSAPLDLLKEQGFDVVLNPHGRILTKEEMISLISEIDGVIIGVDPLDKEVLQHARKLKVISKYGVGTDNIDLEFAGELGIPVTTTVGANKEAVADFAFALMLGVARKLTMIDQECRKLNWVKLTTVDMWNSTLGLIGLGNIGKGVARRAKGFNMKVLAYDTVTDEEYAADNRIEYVSFERVIQESDFISLHLPLIPATRHIIGRRQFEMMKKTAVLVNTARGGLIDEEALYWALKENKIWGAGIDVFEQEPPAKSELLELAQLIIGSHCAASTLDAIDNMGIMASANLIETFAKEAM